MPSTAIPLAPKYQLSDEDHARIARDYVYHSPTEDQPPRYVAIRDKARSMAELLMHQCPRSRELSAALTALDQVVFFANASIARNEAPTAAST